jgi:hypothetical protein
LVLYAKNSTARVYPKTPERGLGRATPSQNSTAGVSGEIRRKRAGMPEIYVSTDVESDGPIPGPHSMLSFGSAAFLEDKTLVKK